MYTRIDVIHVGRSAAAASAASDRADKVSVCDAAS